MQRRDLTFRVFVSSTFSDLKAERNVLQRETFPKLREYCRQRGARFQAIDLRWGVSDEAALDQKTMEICLAELARCQELSPRPNFIILLGQRYGWRPLPARIPASEFEELLEKVKDAADRRLLLWANPPHVPEIGVGWYARDENARPRLADGTIDTAEYVLRPRRPKTLEENVTEWGKLESELRRILLSTVATVGWELSDPRRFKYAQSATHQEIEAGALLAADTDRHVFAYLRTITGSPMGPAVKDFIDSDPDKADLENLWKRLAPMASGSANGVLRHGNVYRYDALWKGDHPEADLEALCNRVCEDLKRVIDVELAEFTQRPALEREQEAHATFGATRRVHFKGRHAPLRAITDYLVGDSNKPLVVHGTSGCGKTALMAQAIHECGVKSAIRSTQTAIVSRFIGATPESADLRSLLRSLCMELGVGDIPQDMNELVRAFRERLSGKAETGDKDNKAPAIKPTAVFLDALDQLNDTDNALMLYWLPRELAPGVKLVLSVLEPESPDGRDTGPGSIPVFSPANPQSPLRTPHSSDPCDLTKRIWPDAGLPLSRMSRQEGADVLDAWLAQAGRVLQPAQRKDLLDKFEADGRPLYLKLAFEEARLWHSWDGLPSGAGGVPGLGNSVADMLDDLFRRLERPEAHGRVFVERALANLAAAKNGLTEDEMLDVLSRDVEVYSLFACGMHHIPDDLALCIAAALVSETGTPAKDVPAADIQARFDQIRNDPDGLRRFLAALIEKADAAVEARIKDPVGNHPEPAITPRLPVVLWSHLHAALKPYLTERRADGTNVMNFYHRQVGQAVTQRYLPDEDTRVAAHQRLAEYFRSLDYWAESLEAQRARAKRLPPTPRPANVRKVVELPYHVLEVAKLVDPESKNPDARYPVGDGMGFKVWDAVADLLTDWQFLEAKAEADPHFDAEADRKQAEESDRITDEAKK